MTTSLPVAGNLIGGKYRIVRLIGEGGMGAVYEARHEHLGVEVALKFLHPELQKSEALVARFLQEARVSASIRSPHVTQVMDVDQTPEGGAYLVMELLEGESLEKRLERQRPLPLAEAVDIGIQTLSALEAAHLHGVVHRDLKPDNVWLSPTPAGPYVKLLDFGIAKLRNTNEFREVNTRPGSMMGTPAYMAPEQAISADQVDARADLYSFGVILYEMLSGARPVDAEDPREILEKLIRGEVHSLASRSPGVPPTLASLVDRLVAPNPDDRPASAALVRAELVPHARASGMVWQGDRLSSPSLGAGRGSARPPSAVPGTIPPDDHSAPAFLSPSRPPGVEKTKVKLKTDSMPAASELAFAPTAVATHSPVSRRRKWPWVVLVLLLLGGSGGAWAMMNPSFFYDDPLPPYPRPFPTSPATATSPGTATPPTTVARDVPLEPYSPSRPTPPPVVRPVPRGPESTPTTTTTQTATPQPPPFPTFPPLPLPITIPSNLIPSSLPSFIPQIPGLTVPATANQAASSTPPTAPAPSGSSSGGAKPNP